MRILFFLKVLLISFVLFSCSEESDKEEDYAYWTPKKVPNPKNATEDGFVSNPDNILRPDEVDEINRILTTIRSETTNEVAVVVLKDIGDRLTPKEFATELFNLWGIGNKEKDNGLLLLIALEQRRWEFETGYGMESILTDIQCYDIGETNLTPNFKIQAYGDGVIKAMKAVAIEMQVPSYVKPPSTTSSDLGGLSKVGDSDVKSDGTVALTPEDSARIAALEAITKPDENSYINEPYEYEYEYYSPLPEFRATAIFFLIAYLIGVLVMFFVKRKNKSFTHLYEKASKAEKEKVKLPVSLAYWIFVYAILPLGVYAVLFADDEKDYRKAGLIIGSFWILLYLLIGFVFLDKRIRANRHIRKEKKDKGPYEYFVRYKDSHDGWAWMTLLFPFIFVIYYIFYFRKKHSLRNQPRACPTCQKMLNKQDEKADDAYLEKGQLLEEEIKSVDYDVWKCSGCNYSAILPYKNFFTRYSDCSSCKRVTNRVTSDVTLVAATTSSTGTGEKTYTCRNCGKVKKVQYTIAMKSSSSSSSGGGGYSGGGGGGSWGGGSSGGGGAGGSW